MILVRAWGIFRRMLERDDLHHIPPFNVIGMDLARIDEYVIGGKGFIMNPQGAELAEWTVR